ncbi:putative leucine-rich repeat receptor-like serine/threonine-protein kinase isoform X1 [Cinnamomum micranthum f. kanehirae]|uniref:Putative leucine-rich repeat receptor-like serine/threonine-protein kinase isoform X1 n=1 Tax=Cinnamomum micranthum f. kanehirae TaxID=337451 RepID=A0A443NI44_9MAGN|nr:putative leucine-rich repeat receptor-like serine/threonine-protein kinase isoform X1 [Cinnamomum micranthum f. kanehirae]
MVLPWLSILMSLLALAVSVHCQPGFLSIDCGIAGGDNYTDDNTTIFYTSDTKFIDTGTNKEIATTYMTQTLPRQYQNLRIFPDGTRNCYTLTPVIKSNRYLLRASFMYGNYDGLDQPPQFDAYVGVNRWEINLPSNSSSHMWNEIITVASLDYISVCLVNTGNGTPFISALELRPLKNLAYLAANESQSLRLLYRNHFRQTASGPTIRYPDDAYDRIWTVWVRDGWTPINNSSPVDLWSDDYYYRLPLPVINTAVIPSDPNNNLTFYFSMNGDPKLQYHVYMHFAELQQLKRNQSREFNIIVNGNLFYGPLSPKYLYRNTIFSSSPLSGTKLHSVVISKTKSSTLPPIFNAEEIFVLEPLFRIPTDSRDVDAIMNIKVVYQIKRNWMGDPCVPSSYSWEGLNCSYPDSKPPTIISLNLSSSGLAGVLAPSLANLTSILSLDVSNNSLTGPVPEFLAELPSLKVLFDNNANVSGPYDINHCEAGSCKKRRRKIVVPILASSISALVMLIIMGFVLWKFTQRRRQRGAVVRDKAGGSIHKTQYKRNGSLHSENQRFTYTEVVNMTNNFESPIGNGGFGTVYHGQMREGTQVAVKMLSVQSVKLLSHPRQGSNEFQNEAQLLMRVHHKNVVPFIGYCQEGDNMALIYEYMALGNLGSHLSGTNSNSKALNWGQRLCIAVDVALGLEYLHNGCRPPIIHRDMKTTNILLNERLEAKIGDFGMSKVFLQDDEFTHISTAVKGTAGYLDPEYFGTNNLTHRSDVYSFGVVLLELITGQPAIIRNTDYEKRTLVDWACPIIAGGDIQSVADPSLEGDYDINSFWKVAEIVLACTSPRSIERPTMTEVVAELKDCLGTVTAAERTRSWKIDQVEKTSSISFQPSPR